MLLALLVLAIAAVALAAPTAIRVTGSWVEGRAVRRERAIRRARRREVRDPGRERRAEQRARELLRSCVNEEEWAMYRDLGFIRVYGRMPTRRFRDMPETDDASSVKPPAYGYLIYPHKPIVAYVPRSGRLLSEYCVEFPDLAGAISNSRLPDSDDVLAKWMALTGDEQRLIRNANMHLPGRQIDPGRVRRDLWRLSEWERQRRGSGPVETRQT
ncbi:MAG: hypothetical protein ACJ768_13110 [Gaiellaceae bacterium]